MIKKLKNRFSVKIFFLTLALLVISNLLLLGGIYGLMPQMYQDTRASAVKPRMIEVMEKLPTMKREEGGSYLNQVCRENDLKLLVQNYISFRQEEIPGFDQDSYGMTWEEAQELWEPQDSGENSMIISGRSGEFILEMMDSGAGQCSFMAAFSDFGPYYFLFMIQEDFTTKAFLGKMIQILPFLLLILLFFAAAASMAYARFISRPILQMARAAQAMSQLEWEKTGTEIRRKDEIGSLARSIRLTAENLEQVLKERDASNKRLQEELEYQKQLKQEQKVFFASASHDLKTPVTVLKGQLTGMLYCVGVYQDRDKYLKKSLKSLEEMERRIQKILEVSQMESRETQAIMEPIELNAFLLENWRVLEDEAIRKGIELELEIPRELLVQGDRRLLQKAAENVLENGLQYSPQGALLRVYTYEEGDKVCLSIENTGVWLPQHESTDLFRPFYRLEESRNRDSGGSGLGLYLVEKALRLQGMEYKIANSPEGVLFSIWMKKWKTDEKGRK